MINAIELAGYAPDAPEKSLNSFESKAAPILAKIRQDGRFPADEEFGYMLNLICLFATSNPRLRRSTDRAWQHQRRIRMDLSASNEALYERYSESTLSFDGFRAIVQRDIVQEQNYKFEPGLGHNFVAESEAFKSLGPHLGDRWWALLTAAAEAPDFISCDHPVVLASRRTAGPIGFLDRRTEVVFPVSPRHALLGVYADLPRSDFVIPGLAVAMQNTRVVQNADRQIYSRSPTVSITLDGTVVEVDLRSADGAARLRELATHGANPTGVVERACGSPRRKT